MNVLVIPRTHKIIEQFNRRQIFLSEADTSVLPEEVAGSSIIRPKEGLLVDPAYFQLWPSGLLCKGPRIYTYWTHDERPCHIWIGNNMLPEDLQYGNYAVTASLFRILKSRFRIKTNKDAMFLGYLCSKHDENQNAFGMLYYIKTAAATIIKNQYVTAKWMTIPELKIAYRKLDPWSKRIFDYIYERSVLRKQLGLYQKKIKIQ